MMKHKYSISLFCGLVFLLAGIRGINVPDANSSTIEILSYLFSAITNTHAWFSAPLLITIGIRGMIRDAVREIKS